MTPRYYYLLSFFIVLFLSTNLNAQKTDTLIHINGNVLTGEIKRLSDGILYFKMDGMGTINVETRKIKSLKSNKLLQIRTKYGELVYGIIDTSGTPFYVKIIFIDKADYLRLQDIIEIYPIKKTFWLRMSGDFNLGFSYAKSTNTFNFNSAGSMDYRREATSTKLEWDSYITEQHLDTSEIRTTKLDASITHTRLIAGKWLWGATVGENSNSALGLKLRLYGGGNIQNDIIYTTTNHLYAQLGANFNRESTTDGTELNNAEAMASVRYDIFKFASPEVSLQSNITAYPNLRFNGRWRLDVNINLNIEVFHNFYTGFKFYTNYDSMPTNVGAENIDWGYTFTLGYSFN